ncbi:MAG TPA: magnesium chelatase domain-containing protein, partial [Anaerolineaceae bacterium]
LNVVGGLQIEEPAADLAVAAAIVSSMKDVPVRADCVFIGEIGLSGELRMVGQMAARLREAAQLGFKTAVVPRRLRRGEPWPDGIKVVEARSLREALQQALVSQEAGNGAPKNHHRGAGKAGGATSAGQTSSAPDEPD